MWMKQKAREHSAKKGNSPSKHAFRTILFTPGTVLDIGCYTGLSALAWYEGTREIQAEVLYFVSIVPANCDLLIFTDHNSGE